MRRIVGFSALLLLGTMGADGTSGSLCVPGMEVGAELLADGGTPDGGEIPDGAKPSDSGGTPDGASMTGGSAKALHLINTVTGEDLGLLVDLKTLTVFSEKLNLLIQLGTTQPTTGAQIFFSELNCNGKRYIVPSTPDPPRLTNLVTIIGPQATYLQPVGSVVHITYLGSTLKQRDMDLNGSVDCQNYGGPISYDVVEYVDTGVKRRPPDNQLKVELR